MLFFAEEMDGIDSLLDFVDDWKLDEDLPLDSDNESLSHPGSSLFKDDILDDSLLL